MRHVTRRGVETIGEEGEDGDPCEEGERSRHVTRRGVETIGDEGEGVGIIMTRLRDGR